MAVLTNYEPKDVFRFFEELNAIPRGSFNTKEVSDYCVKFAKDRGLEVIQDKVDNVIIKKDGTKGYENSEPVIIQGHLDMVCEKTVDSTHDFMKDGLDLYVEDGFVKARNTTLGADDGIAIAYGLALLDSDTIPHPPLEMLFTVDEEVGLGGAHAVDISSLKGKFLINIDSGDEEIILAGCAGGFRKSLVLDIKREEKEGSILTIDLRDLKGGHSGGEIHIQRGNANKMLGRLLNHLNQNTEIRVVEYQGGTKDNVITANAAMSIWALDAKKAKELIKEMEGIWLEEFEGAEPNMKLTVTEKNASTKVLTKESSDKVICLLDCTPYGVQAMMRSIDGVVETSLNLGIALLEENKFTISFSVRSALKSKLAMMQETLNACATLVGAQTSLSGVYPPWLYKKDSKLRDIATKAYKDVSDKEPIVTVMHAGLECGLLSDKKPDLDCISIGPNMFDIHSVDERLDIASTNRTWEFVKKILADCK